MKLFMKMKDFKILGESEKMQVIETKGVFLGRRNEGSYAIALFQIEGFYVELFFHVIRLIYKKIRVFEDTASLDCYISRIDISDLCDCRG